jgi:carboxymethylenebutenolidase
MVTDKPDSPHRVVGDVRAELYLGFGEKDPLTPAADVEAMREALRSTRVRHEVEVYPRATHGFVFPGRGGCYDKPSAERHWERLFALFRRNLG